MWALNNIYALPICEWYLCTGCLPIWFGSKDLFISVSTNWSNCKNEEMNDIYACLYDSGQKTSIFNMRKVNNIYALGVADMIWGHKTSLFLLNWSDCKYEETEWYLCTGCLCLPIWFGSKALLGVSLPHQRRGCIKKTLCYWYRHKYCKETIFVRKWNSFCSSPFRVFGIKPFVFNETSPCPREQYHLAICLAVLILTQYKNEILLCFTSLDFNTV